MKMQIFDQLVDLYPQELPTSAIKNEVDHLHQQMHAHEQQHGHEHHDHDAHAHPELESEAKKRITISLLLNEIIKSNNISLDRTRMDKLISDISHSFMYPAAYESYLKTNKERMREMEALTIEEQVVDLILEQGKTTDKKLSYEEAMKQA
jgi:trigger factor